MEIKKLSNYIKKHFDRIILAAMTVILIVVIARYIGLLKEKSIVFGEDDLYAMVGISRREKSDKGDEITFRDLVDKKINSILGIKSEVSYKKLMDRNPFIPLKELVVQPFSLKPLTLKIGIGKRFTFEPLNGIGPYKWECEPERLGVFEGNEFIAGAAGIGRVIATDARGHRASADKIEVVASKGTFVPGEKTVFIYRGIMKLVTPEGEEILAIIEEISSGKSHFKKSGEEISGFLVKKISPDRLTLIDKNNNKEIELFRK